MDAAADLAARLAAIEYSGIPPDQVEEAKRVLVDVVGDALMGSRSPLAALYERVTVAGSSMPEATVYGGGTRRAAAAAAAAYNASLSHQVELAPIVSRAVAHLDAVVPAAVAIAEREGASGTELLRGIVLGAEALVRFGRALATDPAREGEGDNSGAFRKGWWVPALIAPFGAATAAVVIQGGGERELRAAWGMAANLAPAASMRVVLEGVPGRGFLMGSAVRAGIDSADLAMAGSGGLEDLDDWMSLVVDAHDTRCLNDIANREWEFSGVVYKHFPTVGPIFPALEAALLLTAQRRFIAAEIEEVVVHAFGRTLVFAGDAYPETAEAARSHLGYCLATALLTGDRRAFFDGAFEPEGLGDPDRRLLAGRVTGRLDQTFDREYPARSAKARVEVRLRGGERLEAEADRAQLAPYHHPSWDDISAKFMVTSNRSLDPADAGRFISDVRGFEGLREARVAIGRLSDAMARPK